MDRFECTTSTCFCSPPLAGWLVWHVHVTFDAIQCHRCGRHSLCNLPLLNISNEDTLDPPQTMNYY